MSERFPDGEGREAIGLKVESVILMYVGDGSLPEALRSSESASQIANTVPESLPKTSTHLRSAEGLPSIIIKRKSKKRVRTGQVTFTCRRNGLF